MNGLVVTMSLNEVLVRRQSLSYRQLLVALRDLSPLTGATCLWLIPPKSMLDVGQCRRLWARLPRPATGLSCRCCNELGGSFLNGHYWSHIAFPFTVKAELFMSECFHTVSRL